MAIVHQQRFTLLSQERSIHLSNCDFGVLTIWVTLLCLDPNPDISIDDHYYNIKLILDEPSRYKDALSAYEQVICLFNLNTATYYHDKGAALSSFQYYEQALVAYEQAILLDPSVANYYWGKGATLYNLQCYEEALAALEQALVLNLHTNFVYAHLGFVLNNLGKDEEALTAFDRAIDLGSNDPEVCRQRNSIFKRRAHHIGELIKNWRFESSADSYYWRNYCNSPH